MGAFLAVITQWNVVGTMAGLHYVGLDYAAVRVGLDAAEIAVSPALWTGLRVMEGEYRSAVNSHR